MRLMSWSSVMDKIVQLQKSFRLFHNKDLDALGIHLVHIFIFNTYTLVCTCIQMLQIVFYEKKTIS